MPEPVNHLHSPASPWVCPACKQALLISGRQYRCVNGHCFDQAKEGYVNLLPGHRKHSAAPGDDKRMLSSRREFLQRGYYRVLAERITEICAEECRQHQGRPFNVLDIGCGEGYYTGLVSDGIGARGQSNCLMVGGIDISKDAARLAAKRYKQVSFAVASNADIPVENAWADCVLRIFAPSYDEEIKRIMKPGGLLMTVTPGERHLYDLRCLIYDQPTLHRAEIADIAGLRHVQRERLETEITIDGQGDTERLLAMTPYFWQTSQEKQQSVAAMARLQVELSFCIDTYRLP